MNSIVALVGAGPGQADMLTIRALNYIKKADCIIYDRLINPTILSYCKDNCEKIFVGKENHFHILPQDQINELILKKASEYSIVVRLKGGDPYVFGRGGEEALYLERHNIAFEIVPGVTSAIAALTTAGIPITHRGIAKGFRVITAHSKNDHLSDIDFSKLTDTTESLVFLMGLAHVKDIVENLISVGRCPDTPIAVISCGTTNHQKKVIGNLSNIVNKLTQSDIISPAIIVVGDVVSLESKLSFFESRSLFGKKYFLPVIDNFNFNFAEGVYHNNQNLLEEMLTNKGAEIIKVKSGKIVPLKIDLSFLNDIKKEDYYIFTSQNGVRSFFWNIQENKLDSRALGQASFACIGSKTAIALKSFGIQCDLTSFKQNGEDLAKIINDKLSNNSKVYWLCGTVTSQSFESELKHSNRLIKIPCYENKTSDDFTLSNDLLSDIKACDGAIFTSASNAIFASKIVGDNMPDTIYSIGKFCSKAIRDQGYSNIIEADISSYEGIMEKVR